MTGTWNFNLKRAAALVALFTLPVQAADISLSDGCSLTGELMAMDDSGTITLVSSLSKKPLLLLGEMVKHVGFEENTASESEIPGQRVELINGDVLPVTINGLDDAGMKASSPDLGEVWIPRELISSVQLGIFAEKEIYSGGDSLTGWEQKGGTQVWTADSSGLTAEGSGTLTREVEMPEKFILRFRMERTQQPNFRFAFADTAPGKGGIDDRYYFDFNGSSLSIFRDSKELRKSKPIMMLGRAADRFSGNTLEVEIRGDLGRGLLHLYLDGTLEGRFTDPLSDIPNGSGLTLTNRASQNSSQTISQIQLVEWDERSDRHRSEERGDGTSDAMIGRSGERWGGKLLSIRPEGDTTVYEFKSDFQKEPLLLPESEVSTIFFEGSEESSSDKEGLILRLRGNGELKLASCVFESETVKAKHPLLGEVEVNRAGITALEKRDIPKANPVEE
ncbi:MAG: hypothetical protein NWS48_14890 [Akkermansiaceae bacterium]|nr:hypothetical protein [Akkermansiaceae bacterium]